MKLLKSMQHESLKSIQGSTYDRKSARGILLEGRNILMMYTALYDDYSFPGGGVDESEDWIDGLKRELLEEVGAKNVRVTAPFGCVEEYRPYYKPPYEIMHMLSNFYICEANVNFEDNALEDYEIRNGSRPLWVNLEEAISHNKQVIATQPKTMGFSIARETFVLEEILKSLNNT